MKFFFFSLEHLPIHIYVRNADGFAKFDVLPEVRLIESKGMRTKDLMLAEELVKEHKEIIIKKWEEFHGK